MSRMSAPKPTDPAARMGVYKRLEEVADRHHLEHYHTEYIDRDTTVDGDAPTWEAFISYERAVKGYNSDRYRANAERASRSWRAHMAKQGRHYACADPEHVETWVTNLLNRIQVRTAYNTYWIRVHRFYEWLTYHTGHPHRYNPVLMAANEYHDGASGQVWSHKIGRNDKRETLTETDTDQQKGIDQ